MAEIVAAAKSAMVYGNNAVYATAHSTGSTMWDTDDSTFFYLGQKKDGNYVVYRNVVKFDTSAISGSIAKVTMRLVLLGEHSDTDFDAQIVKYDWSASDPVTDVNKDTIFDGVLAAAADDNIWKNTAGLAINTQYTSGELDPTWINQGGTTYYGLRSSRDKTATQPGGDEYISPANEVHATAAYRPLLTIEYAALGLMFFT